MNGDYEITMFDPKTDIKITFDSQSKANIYLNLGEGYARMDVESLSKMIESVMWKIHVAAFMEAIAQSHEALGISIAEGRKLAFKMEKEINEGTSISEMDASMLIQSQMTGASIRAGGIKMAVKSWLRKNFSEEAIAPLMEKLEKSVEEFFPDREDSFDPDDEIYSDKE